MSSSVLSWSAVYRHDVSSSRVIVFAPPAPDANGSYFIINPLCIHYHAYVSRIIRHALRSVEVASSAGHGHSVDALNQHRRSKASVGLFSARMLHVHHRHHHDVQNIRSNRTSCRTCSTCTLNTWASYMSSIMIFKDQEDPNQLRNVGRHLSWATASDPKTRNSGPKAAGSCSDLGGQASISARKSATGSGAPLRRPPTSATPPTSTVDLRGRPRSPHLSPPVSKSSPL